MGMRVGDHLRSAVAFLRFNARMLELAWLLFHLALLFFEVQRAVTKYHDDHKKLFELHLVHT